MMRAALVPMLLACMLWAAAPPICAQPIGTGGEAAKRQSSGTRDERTFPQSGPLVLPPEGKPLEEVKLPPLRITPGLVGNRPGAAGRESKLQTMPLEEFLQLTLGKRAGLPFLLMPSAQTPAQTLSADLGSLEVEDPLPLVRFVLAGIGLEMRETSGVLVIQRRAALSELINPELEMWVYKPRNRPIFSLATYFPLFPKLSFNYSAATPPRTMEPATMDEYGGTPMPAQGWPGVGVGVGSTLLSGQAFGGSATLSAVVAPAAPGYMSNTNALGITAPAVSDPSFLVVQGHPDDIARLRAFLDKVDIPVAEVLLRAYVLEVRDAENQDSAVQLVLNLLGGRLRSTSGTNPGDADLLQLGGRDISVLIGRLTSDSRVRLVSSPTLRASDGSTASVTIGTDTPTLGSIVTYSGSSQQSITYQSAGVLLNISPRILEETIRLMIWQELSSFVRTETGLTATPTKLRRAFRSDVVARSGETILLGGLSESSVTQARERGILGLGSSTRGKSTSEIVVLLQVQRL